MERASHKRKSRRCQPPAKSEKTTSSTDRFISDLSKGLQEAGSGCSAISSQKQRSAAIDESISRFTPADAPPAAYCRAIRREWAAVVSRELRRTGDPESARRAAAVVVAAAVDIEGSISRRDHWKDAGRNGMPNPNIRNSAVRARSNNAAGALDRVIEAILAGASAQAVLEMV
jgi:hypothetical protein